MKRDFATIPMPHQQEEFMAQKVNLDALIEKEDFEITADDEDGSDPVFCLPELEFRKNTFNILRKPIFQRATSDWTPRQVVDLIKNFIDRDLIPGIIVWNSKSRLQFVMDGAHRLSALIAWVNDDYGFGTISQKVYGIEGITAAHKNAHFTTKDLVNNEIGSYQKLLEISQKEGTGTPEERKRATGMNSFAIVVQPYNKPNARKAEASFYRINQGGTPLGPEEREIIRTRRWPQSIAARTIWRAKDGKKYFIDFEPDKVSKIELLASDCHILLLNPEMDNKTSPLIPPLIGGAETLAIIDQFVHLANGLPARQKPDNSFEPLSDTDFGNDKNGQLTIDYLTKTKRLAQTIASKEPRSLGLHPFVYSYSKTGKFLPGAFFAQVKFIEYLELKDSLVLFSEYRKKFEQFLVKNKHHLTLLTHDGGSKMKSTQPIFEYWKYVFEAIKTGKDPVKKLKRNSGYKHLLAKEPKPTKTNYHVGKTVSMAMKLAEGYASSLECPECRALIYKDAWTRDHTKDGGPGTIQNLKPMHPICNSGHKTKRVHAANSSIQTPAQ